MQTPVLDQCLPPVDGAAASAREATRVFLTHAARARPPTHPGSADIVLLVVGELVANAIRHTNGPCTLHLALDGGHIDIGVADTSPDPPQPRPPHTEGTGGWGWILINHLATNVRIEPAPGGGKTIHTRIPW
ncbi:ATP-binding protein [Streptomyces sp. NBC_00868]|uniref:ATP-binding protein n=1 Tax=unclassified Streptomyces TaxID=2593676 RepID=UPI0032469314|nr:ATP-binding protein [Streptomyces sp. NBC_00868]